MRRHDVVVLVCAAVTWNTCTPTRSVTPRPEATPTPVHDEIEGVDDAGVPPPPLDGGCPASPRGAVCLPASTSLLGVDEGEAHFEERPPHAVVLPTFAIDRREVSTRQWARCVAAGHCPPAGCEVARAGRTPVRCVAWADAAAYCAWRGGRLPTETEWERAAAGAWPEHRLYVWGDASVDGASPIDRTPEGIEDLAGGVAEWVLDGGEFYPSVPRVRDAALDGDAASDGGEVVDVPERNEAGFYVLRGWRGDAHSPWRVVRGGFEELPLARRTTTARRFRQPGDRLPWVGFRCAYGEP